MLFPPLVSFLPTITVKNEVSISYWLHSRWKAIFSEGYNNICRVTWTFCCLLITWTFYNTTASNAKGASMYERERGREKRGRSRGRQRCLAWQQEKKNIHVANLVCEMLSSVCSCCWMCDCVCHVDVMLNLDTHCRIFHNMHLFEDAHGGREVRDKPSREAKQMYKQFLKFVKLLKTFQSSIAVLCRGFLFLLVSACAFMVVILLFPAFCSH